MAKKQKETQEVEAQNQQAPQNPGPILLTRRQRRYMLKQQGVLRYISKLNFLGETKSAIRRENQENGRKLHQQHLDTQEKLNAERLERKLEGYTNEEGERVTGLKDTWKSIGYNDKEIALLEEAWAISVVRDKSSDRKADKKKIKELHREAQKFFASRKK